jgi:hypothetical protein
MSDPKVGLLFIRSQQVLKFLGLSVDFVLEQVDCRILHNWQQNRLLILIDEKVPLSHRLLPRAVHRLP